MYTYGFDIKKVLDNKEDFNFDKIKPKINKAGTPTTPMTGT